MTPPAPVSRHFFTQATSLDGTRTIAGVAVARAAIRCDCMDSKVSAVCSRSIHRKSYSSAIDSVTDGSVVDMPQPMHTLPESSCDRNVRMALSMRASPSTDGNRRR